ncbi:MAG: endonuclease [bacterium]
MCSQKNKILQCYEILRSEYGKPCEQWNLWCKRPKSIKEKEEVIIGSILTQQANWRNVEKAISNLKNAGKCSLAGIYSLSGKNKNKLAELIKPSGFFNQKTEYLLNVAKFFCKRRGGIKKVELLPLDNLRKDLLGVKGIGMETADSILLYALEKEIFVIDEYTKRFVEKNNLAEKDTYNYLQKLFMDSLPCDYALYQDYHALIVVDGKNIGLQKG